jgi:hypothetical protein
MNLFKDFFKRYGIGLILGAATLDGYRRQVLKDRHNNILRTIQEERESLTEASKIEADKAVASAWEKIQNKAAIGRVQEAADEHKAAVYKVNIDPSDYNKNELAKATKKLDDCYDEIRKLDISEYFISLYNNYIEYLGSLTPDKIVCLFNLIFDGFLLSSFFTVLSIMLSENIINKIVFLEKYPRILKLLKLRNNINKKISKYYLFMHFIFIMLAILGNIYMFFI